MDVPNYVPHRSWALVGVDQVVDSKQYECCPNEEYPSYTIRIKVKRHSFYEYSLYVAPALLVLLSLPFIHGFAASHVLELTSKQCTPRVG